MRCGNKHIPHHIEINGKKIKIKSVSIAIFQTFHAPSFGDDDFDVSSMQMMQQAHQMDQYQMPMPSQQMQEQQYMWQQQQEANQRNFAAPPNSMSMPMYNNPMMDPQIHYVSTPMAFI